MGTEKVFRNLSVQGTATVTKTLAASSDMTVAGTLELTKTLTASSGVAVAVESVTSTGTTAKNYGISVISTTKSGTRKFKIGNPAAGHRKDIVIGAITGSSSKVLIRCSSTKPNILSTGGAAKKSMNFATSGMSVGLVGLSTATWQVVANVAGAYGSSYST